MQTKATQLQGLLNQLEVLEFGRLDALKAAQQRQLSQLVQHCMQYSQAFNARMQRAGLSSEQLTLDTLHLLPPLRRRELVEAERSFFCTAVPESHQPVGSTETSGSSGEPVTVLRTELTQQVWAANTLRELQWWHRDLSGTLAVVRGKLGQDTLDLPNWGAPISTVYQTGKAHACHIKLDSKAIANWIAEKNPNYLTIYPSSLSAVLDIFEASGTRPQQLKEIQTIGETLTPALRQRVRELLHVETVDQYSSQELGVIALQCPVSGLYHTMSETLIVEVLHPDGSACQPEETGELVITDLCNYATPLIRYALADYAEVAPPCPCGRSLPTLKRILGRSRHLAIYPDGKKRWPLLDVHLFRQCAPVVQFKIIQKTTTDLDATFVVTQSLTEQQRQLLKETIQKAMGHPFNVCISTQYEQFIPSSNGKAQDFICLV